MTMTPVPDEIPAPDIPAITSASTKSTLYVGGLATNATPALLRAAFVPFGPVRETDVPMDYAAGTVRGFGFVSFEDEEDASEAMYNMDGAELLGRTLTVNVAQPSQQNGGGVPAGRAVWSQDEWLAEQKGETKEDKEEAARAEEEAKALGDR
mmetsp:Transcript_21631/g.49207  ORF Transcript_21631/g.49207 Transcript_21631/m.49207 type:complete len:152 (-) Transcript_21631:783-1238(-)|eukprot:CAMPEP_0113312756 /NCGR_PEP_ID=MMETSP0010_2-20120614/9463_1 /TAXON_ID=216773 ORGANISM="Corethron hystrix, Strain 308" /NCGR_SAMPLE_ID=MMETSP0010_2 /ASSEMBLY_ACC=CAM_ASM_000155 /LENGTH=151 /DNA_ID=CAMNT_0000168653 /DNA_START=30 /DNA_END=485 /DNA_ORIENTATION=+ /assembly_acc=CAM_ASM_000155